MKYGDVTLGQIEAAINKLGGKENFDLLLDGKLEVRKPEKPPLLKPAGDPLTLPAVEYFKADEKFREDVEVGGVRVGYMGVNFSMCLLGKSEGRLPQVVVRPKELNEASHDQAIISALGGEDKAELPLAHAWMLLRKQGAGQKNGSLCVDGRSNIFYVRGTRGNLWAMDVSWDLAYHHWNIEPTSVGIPSTWIRGSRFISRD